MDQEVRFGSAPLGCISSKQERPIPYCRTYAFRAWGGAFLLLKERFLTKEPFGDGDPISRSRHQGVFVEGVAGVMVYL